MKYLANKFPANVFFLLTENLLKRRINHHETVISRIVLTVMNDFKMLYAQWRGLKKCLQEFDVRMHKRLIMVIVPKP